MSLGELRAWLWLGTAIMTGGIVGLGLRLVRIGWGLRRNLAASGFGLSFETPPGRMFPALVRTYGGFLVIAGVVMIPLGAAFLIGPNLTLDITINPDFGQVEADPAEVNLSAYETFFDERRPFLLEGADLFGGRGFYYSRRIGASPPGSSGTEYAERIDNTAILGAAKLTGRMRSGLSIAALTAVTGKEVVSTYDPESSALASRLSHRALLTPCECPAGIRKDQLHSRRHGDDGAARCRLRHSAGGFAGASGPLRCD